MDLNHRPTGLQPVALPDWAIAPKVKNDVTDKFDSLEGDVSIVFATEFLYWLTERGFVNLL